MKDDILKLSTPLGRQQEATELELDNNEMLLLEIFADLTKENE